MYLVTSLHVGMHRLQGCLESLQKCLNIPGCFWQGHISLCLRDKGLQKGREGWRYC